MCSSDLGRETNGGPGGPGWPGDGGGGGDITARICELFACMSKRQVFDDRLLKKLAECGIDGKEAARCLRELCKSGDVSRLRRVLKRRIEDCDQ